MFLLFRTQTNVVQGETINLVSCHDEYSLWFDVVKTPVSNQLPVTLPDPEPGLHLAMSRARLGQVNSQARNTKYAKALKKLLSSVDKEKTVIVISEQSLLGRRVRAKYSS